MTATVGTQLVRVRGRQVRYRAEGSGPVVLLLHGIIRSLEDWDAQFPLLSDRYRVIAVDLAGYGESEPLREPYSLPTLARFVEDVLDALDVRGPVHVAGNSLGGAVAMQLSVQAPERVRTLTLVNSAGFGREVVAALRLLAIRPLAQLVLRRPTMFGARRNEQVLFADQAFVTDERVRRGYRLAGRPHGAKVLLETAGALGGLRGVHPHWRRELLAEVRSLGIPTLVTWGDADRILPVSHLDGARRELAHAETHLFPRTGHMPQIERAQEFAELVTAFWARNDS